MTDEAKISLLGLTWRMGGLWTCLMGLFGAFALGIWLTNAGKANQLEEDGIVTRGQVFNVRQERVFRSDNPGVIYRYVTEFSFTTEAGQRMEGSISSGGRQSGVTRPYDVGDTFDVRYSQSDPAVFEIGEGRRGREAGLGLWGAIVLYAGALGYAVWSVFRAATALGVRDRGEPVKARVVAGPDDERPVGVHLELPDGRRVKNRLTPIKGPRPKVGGTATVYTRGTAAWWEGDLR